jgi:hypothetical protein
VPYTVYNTLTLYSALYTPQYTRVYYLISKAPRVAIHSLRAQPGAPNTFGFGLRRLFSLQSTAGSSQRFRVRSPPAVQSTVSRELPTLSGLVAVGCLLFGAQPGGPLTLYLGSMRVHVDPFLLCFFRLAASGCVGSAPV